MLGDEGAAIAAEVKALGFRYVALDLAAAGDRRPADAGDGRRRLPGLRGDLRRPPGAGDRGRRRATCATWAPRPAARGTGARWRPGASCCAAGATLAELFNAPGDPGRVTFHLNATHALNAALFGLLRPGDRVVRTEYDHNAVRRPVLALEPARRGGRGDRGRSARRRQHVRGGARAARRARLLVITHANNVIGNVLPVRGRWRGWRTTPARWCWWTRRSPPATCRSTCSAMGIDLLAFTGHKGLLGPQGTGGLWVREGVELPPAFFGGTGGDSDSPDMPALLPDRLEAGSMNGPGIAGLLAGVEWLMERGVDAVHRRESALKQRLWEALYDIPGVTMQSPMHGEDGAGIVTITLDGVDSAGGGAAAGPRVRRAGARGAALRAGVAHAAGHGRDGRRPLLRRLGDHGGGGGPRGGRGGAHRGNKRQRARVALSHDRPPGGTGRGCGAGMGIRGSAAG